MEPRDEGHRKAREGGLNPMGFPFGEQRSEEHSFDQLAKEIASPAITRKRVIKVAGISLLGSMSLGLIPGVADARKKKKKCPKPPTCGKGISTGCVQCGTPTKAAELCACLSGADGTPHCIDGTTSPFPPCTTNADCSGGRICVDFTPCNVSTTGKVCALPCS